MAVPDGWRRGWEAQGAGQLTQVSRAASESQAEVTRDGEKTQVAWAGIFEGEEQVEVKVKRVVSLVTGTFTLCPHLGSNHILRFPSQAGGHQPCVVQHWERDWSRVQMEMSCNYEMRTRL